MKRIHVEEVFDHKDYQCVCVFNAGGFRCGYVAIDSGHPYYKKEFTEDGPDNIMCHYGLTYSGYGEHFCQEDNGLWWFGFDCGHYLDAVDYETAKEYGLISEKEYFIGEQFAVALNEQASIKTQEFVKENCKMIVEQLIAIKKRGY